MTYIVYADVMLVTNSVINLFTILMASAIQGKRIRFIRACGWSVLTGILTEISYLLTLNRSFPLHLILYVAIYMFMTYFYFKWNNGRDIIVSLLSVLVGMLLLNGLLNIRSKAGPVRLRELLITIILYSGILCFVCILLRRRYMKSKYLYTTRLVIGRKQLILTGYLDSGNLLTDCFTGNPVVIVDYRSLRNFFDKETYNKILDYHNTGIFDYCSVSKTCNTRFYPLSYQTVSTSCAFMPAFCLSSISFTDSGKTYKNITAGISRYKFTNSYIGDYQVLLNESLKPNREENSND